VTSSPAIRWWWTVGASSDSSSEIVIIGGGCYGTFYVRQLERARAKDGIVYGRLLIVDRDPSCRAAIEFGPSPDRLIVQSDWGDFLDLWLGAPRGVDDAIVPSPLMPHLMYEWLVRRARARWPGRTIEQRPLEAEAGTPYDMLAPDGTRYLSFADWLCPTHCVEPAICPAIRAPRTWEMADTLTELAVRLDRVRPTAGPVILACRHRTYGVGMFDAAEVTAGDEVVARAGSSPDEIDVLVGTTSSCHAAASLLRIGRE
jgi:hypothetical protein